MSYQKDVEDFMSAGDQPINKELSLQGDQQKLYMNLITEEYKETLEAFESNDLIEVADGLADMVWVIMIVMIMQIIVGGMVLIMVEIMILSE